MVERVRLDEKVKTGGNYFSSPKTSIEWRSIPNFPNYEVSEFGHVRRFGKILKQQKGSHNRPHYSLRQNSKTITIRTSKLVACAFLSPRPSRKYGICHRDDNQINNHYTNLYWGTQKDNMRDCIRNGNFPRGERNNTSILTNADVLAIKQSGNKGSTLAKKFNVSEATISRIRSGKVWRHI